jgi:hypothetical protein
MVVPSVIPSEAAAALGQVWGKVGTCLTRHRSALCAKRPGCALLGPRAPEPGPTAERAGTVGMAATDRFEASKMAPVCVSATEPDSREAPWAVDERCRPGASALKLVMY